MKSGLEDRNNTPVVGDEAKWVYVSMKSGLEDRNNGCCDEVRERLHCIVSMKSGLEDRNNRAWQCEPRPRNRRLNEVRPGRPEQSEGQTSIDDFKIVSMKSGLEDRNNAADEINRKFNLDIRRLNEVRPGRPEQSLSTAQKLKSKVLSQ